MPGHICPFAFTEEEGPWIASLKLTGILLIFYVVPLVLRLPVRYVYLLARKEFYDSPGDEHGGDEAPLETPLLETPYHPPLRLVDVMRRRLTEFHRNEPGIVFRRLPISLYVAVVIFVFVGLAVTFFLLVTSLDGVSLRSKGSENLGDPTHIILLMYAGTFVHTFGLRMGYLFKGLSYPSGLWERFQYFWWPHDNPVSIRIYRVFQVSSWGLFTFILGLTGLWRTLWTLFVPFGIIVLINFPPTFVRWLWKLLREGVSLKSSFKEFRNRRRRLRESEFYRLVDTPAVFVLSIFSFRLYFTGVVLLPLTKPSYTSIFCLDKSVFTQSSVVYTVTVGAPLLLTVLQALRGDTDLLKEEVMEMKHKLLAMEEKAEQRHQEILRAIRSIAPGSGEPRQTD